MEHYVLKSYVILFTFSALLVACHDDAGSHHTYSSQYSDVRLPLTGLSGFSYFPNTNFVSENKNITVSGQSDGNDIQSIAVNGEPVNSPDHFKTWSLAFVLDLGDKDIIVTVTDKRGNRYQSSPVIGRYYGVIGQSLLDVTYDSGNYLYFYDYKRGDAIQHSLVSGMQRALGINEVTGLPDNTTSVRVIAANETDVYAAVHWNNQDELYVIDGETLVAKSFFPDNPRIPAVLAEIKQGVFNQDKSELFVVSNNPPTITAIDLVSGKTRLVVDNALLAGDIIVNYIDDIAYDPNTNQLFLSQNSPASYYSVQLTDNASLGFASLPDASAQAECQQTAFGWGLIYNADRTLLQMGDDGAIKNIDPQTGCITTEYRFDEQILQMSTGSLQGLDRNLQTGEYYAGFFPGLAAYEPHSARQTLLEQPGFADNRLLLEEPNAVVVNNTTGLIYSYEENEGWLTSFDPQSGEVLKLLNRDKAVVDLALDPLKQALWIAFDDGSVGHIAMPMSATPQYTEVTSKYINGNADAEFAVLAFAADGRLFGIADASTANVYEINRINGALTPISLNSDNGLTYRYPTGLAFDNAKQQLIVQDKPDILGERRLRYSHIDVETGARVNLNDGADFPISGSYGFAYDANTEQVFTSAQGIVYQYDIKRDQMSIKLDRSFGDSDLGDITDLVLLDDGTMILADDDVNGFWHISLQTNERVLLQ
jgi:hypothetical protein